MKGRTKTTKEFIKEAKVIHGDKYDYSLVVYTRLIDKVKISCPIHGLYEQTPKAHLKRTGCPKCSKLNSLKNLKDFKTTNQFINEAREIHGDKYDYSLVEYKRCNKKIKIKCLVHGIFEQQPQSHIHLKQGCPVCGEINRRKSNTITTEEFIEKSKNLFGNKYDYSLVKYTHNTQKVKIICPIHGMYQQSPSAHLNSMTGCTKCGKELSHVGINEMKYFQPWIKLLFPETKFQHEFSGLPYIVDAFIPSLNLVVEYDENGHKYKKDYDQQRQAIIEDMCGVEFYRIKDKTFLNKKEIYTNYLKSKNST
jgi:very-short-patch-repair endonuclease